MNIAIKMKNINASETVKTYVEKKLKGLDKYANTTKSQLQISVEIAKTSKHHKSGDIFKAEINMGINGEQFYAVSEKEDIYLAIDEVKDAIVQGMKKTKSKKISSRIKGARSAKKIIKRTFKK